MSDATATININVAKLNERLSNSPLVVGRITQAPVPFNPRMGEKTEHHFILCFKQPEEDSIRLSAKVRFSPDPFKEDTDTLIISGECTKLSAKAAVRYPSFTPKTISGYYQPEKRTGFICISQ